MRNIIMIIFNKGMDAKSKMHLHERNAAVEILQNLALSIGVKRNKARPVSPKETKQLEFIADRIKQLLEV